MEYPKKVVGWARIPSKNDPSKTFIRLYCVSDQEPGADREGVEAHRDFYNPEYVHYTPCIGDMIITIPGRFGIDRIVKVG